MQRTAVLILAWLTPPVIAGMLGWTGIWGGSSAFADYLIPIPVAGGALHVPSFAILALFVFAIKRGDEPVESYAPIVAFGIAATALAFMVDFDRLNGWLFTDYQPHGSPLRLDGNPFLLFVTCDAVWGGLHALWARRQVPSRGWAWLPVAPVAVVAVMAFNYQSSAPTFKIGGLLPTENRGEMMKMVYTSGTYDQAAFLGWYEQSSMARPWMSPNSEHEAILFTNSLQDVKWGGGEMLKGNYDSVVGTLCIYEEDQAVIPYRGYHDCFIDRETVEETLQTLAAASPTGLGRDVDAWHARLRFCDGISLDVDRSFYFAYVDHCRAVRHVYGRELARFEKKYGADSPQVAFVMREAAARMLASADDAGQQ